MLDQQWVDRGIQIAIANIVGLTKGQAAGSSGSLRELPLEPEFVCKSFDSAASAHLQPAETDAGNAHGS